MEPSDFVSIYCEMAEIVGVENTCKLFECFRGQSTSFPQRLYNIQYVERYVKENYDGTNLREFAKMFNYSERRIRQLLKKDISGGNTDGNT